LRPAFCEQVVAEHFRCAAIQRYAARSDSIIPGNFAVHTTGAAHQIRAASDRGIRSAELRPVFEHKTHLAQEFLAI